MTTLIITSYFVLGVLDSADGWNSFSPTISNNRHRRQLNQIRGFIKPMIAKDSHQIY